MLDTEIKSYYHGITKKKVRKVILPGITKSLWNSVKKAKDQSVEPIPQKLYKEGSLINDRNVCDEFERYFDEKVKHIVETTTIGENIYNGERKIYSNNSILSIQL